MPVWGSDGDYVRGNELQVCLSALTVIPGPPSGVRNDSGVGQSPNSFSKKFFSRLAARRGWGAGATQLPSPSALA